MTYYYLEETLLGVTTRHILHYLPNLGLQSFPDVETNLGPEREAYLAWVAEGNTATEWKPEA
jgi:hypothetical protein